ncbi:MAG: ABC transporter substrate-binding protein [Acidobacteria bacterium]|nr:ABC transporter substrate-binding protein [Acidobacteriota bacterium]
MKRMRLFAVVLAFGLVAAACGTSDETTTTTAQPEATTTTAAQATTTTAPPEAGMKTGIGVDPDTMTIKLGALHDLTGPFSPLVIHINDAMKVYYDTLNANGGIDGWMIDYQVLDTAYDVPTHLEQYEALRNDVLALTASTGTPTSVAALAAMTEDNMTFIPLSWYSGWGIPGFDGGLGLEMNTNYCIEAMNLMEFIRDQGGQTVAIAGFPSDYGLDFAAGVKLAADFYGMEVVFDGAVIPGQDQTEVITGIVASGADWTLVAVNAPVLAELLGGAFAAGYQGMWTGATPSYNFALLDSPVGPIIDQVYYQSAYNVVWGDDAPGNVEMMTAMAAAFPDRIPSDAFIIGWNEGVMMTQVLADAIAAGDLTREGVAAAVAAQTGVDFAGTTPDQSYSGTPDEYVTRAIAIFNPDLATYLAAGGADQTLSQDGGTTGSLLEQDFFVSEAAQEFIFDAPCFSLEG